MLGRGKGLTASAKMKDQRGIEGKKSLRSVPTTQEIGEKGQRSKIKTWVRGTSCIVDF